MGLPKSFQSTFLNLKRLLLLLTHRHFFDTAQLDFRHSLGSFNTMPLLFIKQ